MRKRTTILAATMLVCGLSVAPAYADVIDEGSIPTPPDPHINQPYYPTEPSAIFDYDIPESYTDKGDEYVDTIKESKGTPGLNIGEQPGEYGLIEDPGYLEYDKGTLTTPIANEEEYFIHDGTEDAHEVGYEIFFYDSLPVDWTLSEEKVTHPIFQQLDELGGTKINNAQYSFDDIPDNGIMETSTGSVRPKYSLFQPDGSLVGYTTSKTAEDKAALNALVTPYAQDVIGESTDEGTSGEVKATASSEEAAKVAAKAEFIKNHNFDGATITSMEYGYYDCKVMKIKMTQNPSWWPEDYDDLTNKWTQFYGPAAWWANITYVIPPIIDDPVIDDPGVISWSGIPDGELVNPLHQWLEDNAHEESGIDYPVLNGDLLEIGWYTLNNRAIPYYPLLLPDGSFIGYTQGTSVNKQDALVDTTAQDVTVETTDEGTYGKVIAASWNKEFAKQAAEAEFRKNHSSDGGAITTMTYGYYPNEHQKVKLSGIPTWWPPDEMLPNPYITFYGAGAWVAEIVYLVPAPIDPPIIDDPDDPVIDDPVIDDPIVDDPVVPDPPAPADDPVPTNPDPDEPVGPDPSDFITQSLVLENAYASLDTSDTTDATDEAEQVGYPVQTGDHLGIMDKIAITITACLAALFLALGRRFDEEE